MYCAHDVSPGRDATDPFEDVGHSPDAREQQQKYLIGEVSEPRSKKVEVRSLAKSTKYCYDLLIIVTEKDNSNSTREHCFRGVHCPCTDSRVCTHGCGLLSELHIEQDFTNSCCSHEA